ncbi:copper chaperone PCu(A)C [Saccharopolyspora sp. K220]|uniref:copper chaperone PCu(A)C n=1 Tax=Saccharopolyspora soli TaxID=2926618 RepID=UPI001F56062B|nr:copper chaperone PCu(A)C [Saccharopolyspora soli]MCI2424005.1 copper chaperone PCu(A)C [Saccharopolyspora soli]
MSRPQHFKAARLRLIPAAIGLGAVVALAGCSAGQVTETDTQVAAVNGGSGDLNKIAIRNATFIFPTSGARYPAGSSAPVQLVLTNEGPDDKLVQVSSPYANSATLGGITELPSRTALHATGGSAQVQQAETTADREVQITLNGFKQDIGPGVTVPVTFVFEKAGAVTVQVPIGPDHSPRAEHGSPMPGTEQHSGH